MLLLLASLLSAPTPAHAVVKVGTVHFLEVYSSAQCSSGIAATAAYWNKEFCVTDSPYARRASGTHRFACIRVDNGANLVTILHLGAGC